MTTIDYDKISDKITEKNKIGDGKEVKVYEDGKYVIKIFKENRLSDLKRISDEGLIKLSTLDLKHFNTPTGIILKNGKIVGYKEKLLKIKDLERELSEEELDEIKNDIILLSRSGFMINDIMYNYTDNSKLFFFDLTSYTYTNSNKKELLDYYYKKNILTINIFLVGLTMFGAYKHGEKYEFTKTYLAYEFITNNLNDQYFGDYLKNNSKSLILI